LVSGGTFTHNSGTVTLNSASTATLDAPSGGLTFWDLESITAGKVLQFSAGDTFNIAGTLTLTGASGNLITLESTSAGTRWNVNPTGRDISFVDVADSYNTSGTLIDPTSSTNGGNNIHWFTTDPLTPPTDDDGGDVILPPLPDPDPDPNPDPGDPSEEIPDDDTEQPGDDTDRPGDSTDPTVPGDNGGGGTNPNPLFPIYNTPDSNEDDSFDAEYATVVTVKEGAVNVDNNMIYDGESILMQKGKTPKINVRALYIAMGEGVEVLRAKVHTPLKKLKLKDAPGGLAIRDDSSEVFTVLPGQGQIFSIDTSLLKSKRSVYGLSRQSGEIVVDHEGSFAYISDSYENKIQKIDLKKNQVVEEYRSGSMPCHMALSQDDQSLYVANFLDGTIWKISTQNGKQERVLNAGRSPCGICLSKDEREIFVADNSANQVLAIPLYEGSVRRIPVGLYPYSLKMNAQGTELFVTNRGSDTVSTIRLSDYSVTNYKVGRRPCDVVITPEGDKAYVSNALSGDLSLIHLENGKIDSIPLGIAPSRLILSTPGRILKETEEPPVERTDVSGAILEEAFMTARQYRSTNPSFLHDAEKRSQLPQRVLEAAFGMTADKPVSGSGVNPTAHQISGQILEDAFITAGQNGLIAAIPAALSAKAMLKEKEKGSSESRS